MGARAWFRSLEMNAPWTVDSSRLEISEHDIRRRPNSRRRSWVRPAFAKIVIALGGWSLRVVVDPRLPERSLIINRRIYNKQYGAGVKMLHIRVQYDKMMNTLLRRE